MKTLVSLLNACILYWKWRLWLSGKIIVCSSLKINSIMSYQRHNSSNFSTKKERKT